ncbi:MAG: M6 family metalloprotease domain-containing protein [Bacteroides sp.]|nr:M6 family metalloprotease domain-containing protein [Ruminococcus flavefaciens]MCM1554240.1 M6 family metalloprotease domain-containing protein [Bacteroides sp.]
MEKQFYYAVTDKDGNMVASKVKAHDMDQRTRQEKKLLKKTPKQLRYSPQQRSTMRARGPVAFANDPARTLANSPLAKAMKNRKGLTEPVVRRAPIILINFADRKMSTPKANYEKLINTRNYTENGCTGSFLDYFLDNSRGLFRFEADVIGPITLSKNRAYYGGNDPYYDEDEHPQEMAEEACRLALASGVDFSKYDFDGDGYLDGVHIIFPGKGEETSGDDDAIWSHMWNVETPVDLNGTYLDVYSCSAELSYDGDWDCIGTPVHELSHVFGLPDLYDSDDTDNGSAVDPDEFDVMAGGSYNNDSRTPPLHNAWSRIQMGWLDPVELTEACKVKLYPAEEATTAFYYNTPVEGEYFVLDYRGEESKWDEYIPGHGMLIFAVNENVELNYDGYTVSAWEYNCINCKASDRGFYIKQANGGKESNSSMGSGTPFPGSSNKTSFTDQTAPASTSHSGQKTNKPITEIAEMEEGGVSFVFIDKSITIRDNLGNVRTSDDPVPVRTPMFNPNGGAVTEGTRVTITSSTPGATIYYTQDGSEPTVKSTVYSSPIVTTRQVTLKAFAVKEGWENSAVATATFTIKGNDPITERVADPVFDPQSGAVPQGRKVRISCATEGATIFYTTDGSEPTPESNEYTDYISITKAVTIKAVAIKEEMQDSRIVTAKYTIRSGSGDDDDPNVANESEEQAGIKVYPNPNDGHFYIELPETAEVSVFSINGALLEKQSLRDGLHEMRLDRSGSYILRIRTSRASVSKRVIVR